MRRPRRLRLTGSTRRLLAAAGLASVGAAACITVASADGGSATAVSGVPSAGGLHGSLAGPLATAPAPTLPVSSPLPPVLKPVLGDCLVLCPPSATPPLPSLPLPSLPLPSSPLPTPPLPTPTLNEPCVTSCPGSGGTGSPSGGATPAPGQPTGAPTGTAVAPGRPSGPAGPGPASAGSARVLAGSLDLPQPPPVEQLTPLAGISFGQAPYMWPLFMLLDVLAAVAVAVAVRKTWSTPGSD